MAPQSFKDDNLHGNVPDSASVVLMLVDVINDLDFPGNGSLVKQAGRLGVRIAALKRRCYRAGIPVIYVNDNRGRWRSDFGTVLSHSLRSGSLGKPLVEKLIPGSTDYVVLKPKHSAFYATPLDTILTSLRSRAIILAGLTTAACILLTAGEIYIRDLKLYVPSDCVAALRKDDHLAALKLMRANFEAVTTPAARLNLKSILRPNSSKN